MSYLDYVPASLLEWWWAVDRRLEIFFCAASARDFRGIQKNTKHKCTEIYDIISSLLLPKSPPFNLYISVFLFIEIWIDMSFLHRF